VGWSETTEGFLHATVFDSTGLGNNIDLETLGGQRSEATAINNLSQIVGWSYIADGSTHAFMYDSGFMIDLNTLIDPYSNWTLTNPFSINDKGWIVGYGINPDGYEHAFLLTPEPATILLISFGGLVLLRKRKA
jgi:probable HAF family extracellular repeat protein